MNRSTANGFALIGTVCLQCSAVPAIIQALQGGETAPLATLVFVVLGLLACAVTEIHYKLWAYLVGSIIGLSGHIAIIAIVLARHH
jgi:tryptophan-rich sensory protein